MSEATRARPGEELNQPALAAYLSQNLSGGDFLEVAQFPAGSSNLTYLIKAGGEEYVLRRPPFGNTVKSAHDMRREFNVLSKLSAVYAPAPKPILFCDDLSVIGAEFYLMERRHGLIIRGKAPSELEGSRELQRFGGRKFYQESCIPSRSRSSRDRIRRTRQSEWLSAAAGRRVD